MAMDNGGNHALLLNLHSILSNCSLLPPASTPWPDFHSACSDLLAITPQHCPESPQEAELWLTFAQNFSDGDLSGKLQSINDHLLKRSVLAGLGTSISLVDITVFVAVRDALIGLISTHKDTYQNLVRWFDYIQNEENVAAYFKTIPIELPIFEPPAFFVDAAKKPTQTVSFGTNVEINPSTKSDALKKESNKVSDKAKQEEKEAKAAVQKKEADVSVSALDIRVGLVQKVWKHPNADALLVEEIDLGESGVRQVVSGLAKYVKEEEMLNRRIVMIANVKPGKLRDVLSAGLVLCASNSDHNAVEPLMPPDAAAVGERVTFAGHDGQPEEVLNPKKKQLEKILPDLLTDDNGVATYKGIPFMTSAGPCKSTLTKAVIR